MKLGIVTYSLQIGGAERSIFLMAKMFQKNGFEVEVIESEKKGPWRDYFIKNAIPVKSYYLSLLTVPYLHTLKISKEIKGFDILFLFDSPFAQASLGKVKQSTICFPQLRVNLPLMYFNAVSNRTQWNYITANSPSLKAEFSKQYPDLSNRVKIIPNGIPIPPFRAVDFKKVNHFKIIYVGRFENTLKGILIIPQIIFRLKLKEYNISITFVGDGPARNDLFKLIQDYNLESDTHFLGYVQHESINEILRDNHFLIMPSNSEGFPNAMLEAMANQVIPVVSYLKGVTDICVMDSYNGFFGQPNDVESFVAAFERAFALKDKLNTIAKNAYETIRKNFSIETVEKKYLDLIRTTKSSTCERSGRIDISFLKHHYPYFYLPLIASKAINKFRNFFSK